VVIAILQCLFSFVVPFVAPDETLVGVLAGPVCALAIVLWWVFFSRAPWSERLGAVALMIVVLFATSRVIDKSLATGAQRMLFPILAIPALSLAFVVWAVATSRLLDGLRRATMVATILVACGAWALVRTGGFTASSFHNDLHWRWTKTPEERLLAKSGNEPGALVAVRAPAATPEQPPVAKTGNYPEGLPPVRTAAKTSEKQLAAKASVVPRQLVTTDTVAEWPGFRGPHRDDIVPGVRIKTDWTASPPVALWLMAGACIFGVLLVWLLTGRFVTTPPVTAPSLAPGAARSVAEPEPS